MLDRAFGSTSCRSRKQLRALAVGITVPVIVAMFAGSAASSGAPPSAAACSPSKPFIEGAPSSLLSILGVLRRPATPADALPPSIKQFLTLRGNGLMGIEVYAKYVRRVVIPGEGEFYVWPILRTVCGISGRPATARESMDITIGGSRSSWGGAGDATAIEQGTAFAGASSFGSSTIDGLVPDGVAEVTLRYPAGKIGGFDRNHAPAFTTTQRVVGNVLAVTIPRGGNRLQAPMTMTWRGANGHVVKTFNRL